MGFVDKCPSKCKGIYYFGIRGGATTFDWDQKIKNKNKCRDWPRVLDRRPLP